MGIKGMAVMRPLLPSIGAGNDGPTRGRFSSRYRSRCDPSLRTFYVAVRFAAPIGVGGIQRQSLVICVNDLSTRNDLETLRAVTLRPSQRLKRNAERCRQGRLIHFRA